MDFYKLFNQEYQKGLNRPAKRSMNDEDCQAIAGQIIRQFCGSNASDGDILKICEYQVRMVTMT